jgi:signal transduction histidine kinase
LVAVAGDGESALPELRAAARRTWEGETVEDLPLTLVTIEPPGAATALLAGHDPGRAPGAHGALLRAARPALSSLLGGRRVDDGAVVTAGRHLDRLRYDLHDGPQQDLHLLAQDLRLFREQLAPMIATHPDRDRALGRLDDLEAQLIALDTELRRLVTLAGSPLLEAGSLAQALTAVAESFTARSGIVPETRLQGDVESLTESQQIALLSLVRESLSNIRRHSDAEHVTITVTADGDAITAEIRDDGSGFLVEETSDRAAATGHLGLVGMRERMRMLGGDTHISSAPGGPTVVTASLPRWPVEPAGG